MMRPSWFKRHIGRHIDAIPLATKLVACIIVLLTIGSFSLSFAIRQLVSNYLLEKTDSQLINQSQLVARNTELLSEMSKSETSLSMTSYYVQMRDYKDNTVSDAVVPNLRGGVVSKPVLPTDDNSVSLGQPFTTAAKVSFDGMNPANEHVSRDTIQKAGLPWRVVALRWVDLDTNQQQYTRGTIYIGLSLSDQYDTADTITRYSAMVGIAVVLLGGVIGMLVVQATLAPLKRIEKTAAKIAAGDLSQRVPSAPENTEVGSLAASLNAMLTRIEQSFHEQQETTDKMKRFVSDASHELRTPLAAIHGYAELYKMQREFPGALERADESIEHIEASSARMTVLVEDLLSLARLDEGRGIDLTQQVPLTSIVSDATDDLHALDPERGIREGHLELRRGEDGNGTDFAFVEGDMPQVTLTGDGSRLRQVVTNIVGNIHRYTPADSPVEVSMSVLPASISPESLSRMPATATSMHHLIEAIEVGQNMQVGMNYAIVRFSDHGPGVPEASRAQIFERFYTADPSRARLKGGTGLGMAIAQSVVKAHRGFICATGSEGGGLTLTVVLPVAPVEPTMPAPVAKDAANAAASGKTGWTRSSERKSAKSDRKNR
ncbi:HAMP domain-containing histidine kinase [Bifidobacterium amazonense]|uniref:histidine kinase n=2 Tax=Bifidobacterium amazonense TaxID=2809027 RepID=A0ABS9VYH5_9BIFI|nr:HAMP domain-containing sensor histidine kinase [Bifidobacterium amazonense]MCH9277156.1 HAMP domain-containing histidine kinase [Bifidobacterium amazonense]